MTSKMPLLFAKDPPRKGGSFYMKRINSDVNDNHTTNLVKVWQFNNLDAIVDDWIYRFGAKGKNKLMRDTCVEYCEQAESLVSAINRACASKRTNGKTHNHQSRVKPKDREWLAAILKRNCEMVFGCKDFDELHDYIDESKPSGIGPVTVYDVATRIAAYLKLPITSLYLHAGVRVGWCLLHGARSPALLRIPAAQLPKPLQRIPCDEVEDMLCAYRDYLKPWCKQ